MKKCRFRRFCFYNLRKRDFQALFPLLRSSFPIVFQRPYLEALIAVADAVFAVEAGHWAERLGKTHEAMLLWNHRSSLTKQDLPAEDVQQQIVRLQVIVLWIRFHRLRQVQNDFLIIVAAETNRLVRKMSVKSNQIDWLEVAFLIDFSVSDVAVQPDFAVNHGHVFGGRFMERKVVRDGLPFTGHPVIGPEFDRCPARAI